MKRTRLFTFSLASAALLGFAASASTCLPPVCVSFPADAGALNVRNFGAKGDGVTDDTAAINAAIAASGPTTGATFWHDKLVYLPDGTYLVSAPLLKRYANGGYANGLALVGQSKANTIIRLADHATGYADSTHPQAVIFTTSELLSASPTAGGKNYTTKGEGNDAYENFVENLTVDAGQGNPGAIGIDYLANNIGAIRHVLVTAATGSGATGISMTRKWPGPALLSDVTVQGFDTGIDVDNTEYGMTLDTITITNPRTNGLRNNHNVVSSHNVTITGAPNPLVNLSLDGLIVLDIGSITTTPAVSGDAIQNNGYMNLHAVTVQGYGKVLGLPARTALTDGVYKAGTRLSPSQIGSLVQPQSPPSVPADSSADWASVAHFGATPDSGLDATAGIRQALASGATTVYFPHGTYLISDNIVIPSTVQRIVGMNSTIHVFTKRAKTFSRDQGMFRAQTTLYPLTIEHLAFDNSNLGAQTAVEAAGPQPLVMRDIVGAGVTTLLRPQSAGQAFVEDTCCGLINLAGPNGVWMWQLNSEGGHTRVVNNGSPLWILGIKTERDCTVIDSSNHALTEVVGGLLYIVLNAPNPAIPAFISTNSKMMLAYAEEAFSVQSTYDIHLTDNEGSNKPRLVEYFSLPPRNHARMAVQIMAP